MPEFKFNIGDPKTSRCKQVALTAEQSAFLIGKKIGDKISGESLGFPGYEFEITGGSDYCGFPMKKGVSGTRKKILIGKGVGIRKTKKGTKFRKTVCGETIHDKIVQVNVKIVKYGPKPIIKEPKPAEEKSPQKAKPEEKEKPAEEQKKEETTTEEKTQKEEKKEEKAK